MMRAIEACCRTVDLIAGALLGICTLLIVASAMGRYLFATPIPDAFDISRLMIGACLMWGYASIGYRGGHIAVDIVWEILGQRGRRTLEIIAWLALLGFTVLLAYKMYFRVHSAYLSNESTFDLRIRAWPFMALIWVGCLASVGTIAASIVAPRRDHTATTELYE